MIHPPKIAAAVLAAALVIGNPALSQSPVQVFTGARLIVGDGSQPIENAVLLVRDGRIVAAGSSASVSAPAGAERVDLAGRTVMPMLIDTHGHVGYMSGNDIAKEHYSRQNILDHLRRLQYYGVGAIASLGTDRDDLELRVRDEQRSGVLNDPDLALLLTANDGIVPFNGGKPNGGPAFARDVVHEAANPAQAREHVRAEAAKRVDFIKFWNDDRNGSMPKMPVEMYSAIIDESSRLGVPVVAHTFYLADAKGAVRAGVSGLAHPVRDAPVDAEFVSLMKANDVFQCSNVSLMAPRSWLAVPELVETESPAAVQALRSAPPSANAGAHRVSLSNLKMLSDAGVRIALCADAGGVVGQFPGSSEHRELQELVDAGIPPLRVIQYATQVSAAILKLNDLGTIAPGKRADFLVLSGNPADDISNTRRIAAIYKSGRVLDRNALRARLATVQ